ncbi:MAG: RNA methyltransferase [Bdellovibrionota bacterium]
MTSSTFEKNRIVVVLNRPIYGRNVGMCARAMANMGLDRLVVIGARGEIDVDAKQGAAHAQEVLASLIRYDSLADFTAAEGEGVRIALSGKDARLQISEDLVATLKLATSDPEHRIHSASTRIYLMFGPEDDGLSAEEMEICHFVCRLPTYGTITSLNLSHAVLLASYIVRSELDSVQAPHAVAGDAQLEGVVDERNSVKRWLEALGFDVSSPRINIEKTLNRILMSRTPTPDELRLLRTVLEQTIRKLKR